MAEIERREEHGYTIIIETDEDTRSPRDDFPSAAMVLSHRRYNFPNDAGIYFGYYSGWDQMRGHLASEHGALVIMGVYMLDHSMVSLRAGDENPFRDPWDSGQLGLAYVTRDIWAKAQGTEWTGSDEQVAQARLMIEQDVKTYGQYVNGECYRYTIEDADGNEVDACSGYIGDEHVDAAVADELARLVRERGESVPADG